MTAAIVDRLATALDQIRACAVATAPDHWPELRHLLETWLPRPMDPQVAIPLATATGAGAALDDAIPFAAVWALVCFSVRILDDCADGDNPRAVHLAIGVSRALNVGTAGLLHAGAALDRLPGDRDRVAKIVRGYLDTGVQACAGQDRDITAPPASLAAYLDLVEAKTACAFAFAAWGAAQLHTDDAAHLAAARACGRHAGVMLQILDDLEATWFPVGLSDLAQGKRTLPMFFGLAQTEHRHHGELARLLAGPNAWEHERRMIEILDEMGVRRRLVWAAVKERDLARAAAAALPRRAGLEILNVYLDWTFRDVEQMMTRAPG